MLFEEKLPKMKEMIQMLSGVYWRSELPRIWKPQRSVQKAAPKS